MKIPKKSVLLVITPIGDMEVLYYILAPIRDAFIWKSLASEITFQINRFLKMLFLSRFCLCRKFSWNAKINWNNRLNNLNSWLICLDLFFWHRSERVELLYQYSFFFFLDFTGNEMIVDIRFKLNKISGKRKLRITNSSSHALFCYTFRRALK